MEKRVSTTGSCLGFHSTTETPWGSGGSDNLCLRNVRTSSRNRRNSGRSASPSSGNSYRIRSPLRVKTPPISSICRTSSMAWIAPRRHVFCVPVALDSWVDPQHSPQPAHLLPTLHFLDPQHGVRVEVRDSERPRTSPADRGNR